MLHANFLNGTNTAMLQVTFKSFVIQDYNNMSQTSTQERYSQKGVVAALEMYL